MDIKELALKVAKEMNWRMDEMTLETFATRRIAALEQQVAALTKARDELEISNAFAHGEWRAVKDQLAAMTKERNHLQSLTVVNESLPVPALRRQLAAAQAREAKRLKTISDEATAIAFYGDQPPQWMLDLIALPTDDSALMERLAQERERVAQMILNGSFLHTEAPVAIWAREVAAAIRSMT